MVEQQYDNQPLVHKEIQEKFVSQRSDLVRAIIFANEAHAKRGQLYNGEAYIVHPFAVMECLQRFHFNHTDMLITAICHDLLEDTDVTKGHIEVQFGTGIANCVEAVTDKLPGRPRKERHAATYPALRHRVIPRIVKMGDRIVNVEAGGKTDMYREEHAAFKAMIFDPTQHYSQNELAMWDYLDGLLDVTSEQMAA